jgi:hypothetical protein
LVVFETQKCASNSEFCDCPAHPLALEGYYISESMKKRLSPVHYFKIPAGLLVSELGQLPLRPALFVAPTRVHSPRPASESSF